MILEKQKKRIEKLPTDNALSFRQPYAQLVVSPSGLYPNGKIAVKWIENRTWLPGLATGDRLLIHAAGTVDPHRPNYEIYGLDPAETPHGAIVGYVTYLGAYKVQFDKSDKHSRSNTQRFKDHLRMLRDIVFAETGIRPSHGAIHAEQERDMYHWIFCNPVMLDEPIEYKGTQKIWKYKP